MEEQKEKQEHEELTRERRT